MPSLRQRRRVPEIMDQPDLASARHIAALRRLGPHQLVERQRQHLMAAARRTRQAPGPADPGSRRGFRRRRCIAAAMSPRLRRRTRHPDRRLRPQPGGRRICAAQRRRLRGENTLLCARRTAWSDLARLRRGDLFSLSAPSRRGAGGRLPALGGGNGGTPSANQ